MESKITEIKKLIQSECAKGLIDDWFFEKHLCGVEHFARELLKKLPEANEEVVMLGVWLHDLQRIRALKGDHQEVGAAEAEKVMREFGYDEEVRAQVKEMILCHSCDSEKMPESLEAKILASADAMSHYINDFFLYIAITGQRTVPEFKEWFLEKLDRNWNRKIYFDFAKEMIKEKHEVWLKILS